jgi:NAD(P)H-flavin reductase
MYKILKKKALGSQVILMDIEAPRVAKASLPGQFVIVITDEKGERIPLTICDYDKKRGTVTIVFQTVGDSTRRMAEYDEGDSFFAFTGPLGHPSDFVKEPLEEVKKKKFIFIGGGVGVAPVYPQVKWLKEQGIDVDVIIGARNKDLVILEEEMRAAAKNLYVCTDDGSYGFHGLVTDCLRDLVEKQGKSYDHAVIIGPMIMMKFAAKLTKELNIPTVVSLNTIMVDGTGMCGACRVMVGGEVKFTCVDGPEFDGHLVDYDGAMRRMSIFKTEEGQKALREAEGKTHRPKHGCGVQGAKIG